MNAPSDPATNERYTRIVESIDQLPALPSIVARLIQVVNSPDSSADDAAHLIERDPALTSRMLRLANSAFYGIPRTISSVSSAVVILGFNTIKSLVLSASVMQMFPGMEKSIFDKTQFWKHSIVCAMAAKRITRARMAVRMMDPESAFCAGILHDIGKLVFERYAHVDYNDACEKSKADNVPLIDAETALMGINHAQVGRLLADRWALPLELEASIVSHHDPASAGKIAELVTAVHLADCIAHAAHVSTWDNEAPAREWRNARAFLKLDDGTFDSVVASVQEEIQKSDEFLSVIS